VVGAARRRTMLRRRPARPRAGAIVAQDAARLTERLRERALWKPSDRTSDLSLRLARGAVQLGPVLVLILLWVTLSLLSPVFFTQRNLTNLGVQASMVAVLAIGQLIVIITRGIDLSVGSVLSLATVTGGLAYDTQLLGKGLPVVVTMLLTGAAVGLLNGMIFVKGRIPHAFIVTLAMLYAARGLALVLSDGASMPGMPDVVQTAGGGFVGDIPVPVIIVLVVGVISYTFMQRTRWGRWIYATGGNPEGASRAGIPVGRVLISAYVLCGLAAGLAGVMTAGRTNSGFPTAGSLAELDAIAAAIIGGASLFGGRGNVVNAIVGALILATIRNGLNLLDVSPFWQLLVIGAVILIAVELDVMRTHVEERLRARAASR
jgi:ribose transport system permease protein